MLVGAVGLVGPAEYLHDVAGGDAPDEVVGDAQLRVRFDDDRRGFSCGTLMQSSRQNRRTWRRPTAGSPLDAKIRFTSTLAFR